MSSEILPKTKPFTLKDFQSKTELYMQGFYGGFPKTEMIDLMQKTLDRAVKEKIITQEEGMNFINEKKNYYLDILKKSKDPYEGVDFPEIEGIPRINQATGTKPETASEKWMRDYFFSGKGGFDNIMSFDQFKMGPGKDLYERFGKKKGGLIYGKYAKQILSS
jgi:hypothetical protein